MKTNIFGATGLSLLLLFGSTPTALLAHEGHEHGDRRGRYSEREDSGRYSPQREDDRWEEEDEYEEENDRDQPSPRRYPPPEGERSYPRERSDRPW